MCVCVCVTDVEVDVDELNQEQVLDINKMASPYGMAEGDFVRLVCHPDAGRMSPHLKEIKCNTVPRK